MCDEYKPCIQSFDQQNEPLKVLTILLLDCWQREYDKRPYRNFRFVRTEFEERMKRKYHHTKDFSKMVEFLYIRPLCTVSISGIRVVPHFDLLLSSFVNSLLKFRTIELRLMKLPRAFFLLLGNNVEHMHVKELSFEGTVLLTKDIIHLRHFLIESKTLQYLNVAHCSLTQYNFALLADGIHKSTTIRGFNCSRLLGKTLTLDTTKIAYVVSSLIWQNKLENIEMQKCEFVAYDMEILSEYINGKNSKLVKLNLAYNKIASDGAETLFRAISNSGTLTHLNIAGNGLGSHGGDVVAKYLSSCYALVYLNITNNDIGAESISNILTAMKKRKQITTLKLYGNRFDGRCAMILRRLLDSRVVLQEWIDITYTANEFLTGHRIVPWL